MRRAYRDDYFQRIWIKTITMDSPIQVSVLAVNMDSFKRIHVNIGNEIYDSPNAKSLTLHAVPSPLYICFVAKKAHRLIGIENIIATNSDLSRQNSLLVN
mgnify:FL=1